MRRMAASRPVQADDTTVDGFLGGSLRLAQRKGGHRAGLDAVMLAAAAPVKAGDRVLDAGSGMGVVGLCVAARVPGCHVQAVDIDAQLVDLANLNAARNGLTDRYAAVAADLTGPLSAIESQGSTRDSFDVVLANPPFHGVGRATVAPEPSRRRASIMPEGGLAHWIRFMTAMAAPGGSLVLIHRADALGEILALLQGRCGAMTIFPLYPRLGAPAHRVIVSARKGSRAGIVLCQGMILHSDCNAFTPAAEAVLRHGAALDATT